MHHTYVLHIVRFECGNWCIASAVKIVQINSPIRENSFNENRFILVFKEKKKTVWASTNDRQIWKLKELRWKR